MSNEILNLKNPAPLREIDQLAKEYQSATVDCQAQFELMAITANAVSELKKRLPDEMVQQLKKLENTKLGFRTDKEQGYDSSTIRDCMIEAVLRGVKPIGNEFNIIAGNFYLTKEGFTGLMNREQRLTELKLNLGVPKFENNRAVVGYTTSWKWDGQSDSMEGEVPIKLNKGMGDDAVLGKAERKVRARIWAQATGNAQPEGEVVDYDRMQRAEPVQPAEDAFAPAYKAEGGVE